MQVNNPGNSLGLIEIRLNTLKLHQESQINDLKASVRNLEAIRDHLMNELNNKSSTNNISIDSDMNPYHPTLESASFKDEEKMESSTDAHKKDKYQAAVKVPSSKKLKKKKSGSKRKESSKALPGDGKSGKRTKKHKDTSKDDKTLESKKKKKEHRHSRDRSKGIFSNWKQSKPS